MNTDDAASTSAQPSLGPTEIAQPIDPSQSSVENKPSSVRYLFIILGIVQILILALLSIGYILVMNEPAPKENLEFNISSNGLMLLIALFVALPLLGIISLIILVGLPIYLYTHKTNTGLNVFFAIISILLSLLLVSYWIWRLLPFSGFNSY